MNLYKSYACARNALVRTPDSLTFWRFRFPFRMTSDYNRESTDIHENTRLKNPLVSSLSATDELKKFFRSVFVKNKNLLKIPLLYLPS